MFKQMIFFLLFLLVSVTDSNAREQMITLQNDYELTITDGLLSVHADNINFKDILKDLEDKAGIKFRLIGNIPDKNISIDINDMALTSIDALLQRLDIHNYSIVYDFQVSDPVIYILAEGLAIEEVINGKPVALPANFTAGTISQEIQGREIRSAVLKDQRSETGPLRYMAGEILLKFHHGVTSSQQKTLLDFYDLEEIDGTSPLVKLGYVKAKARTTRDLGLLVKKMSKNRLIKIAEPNFVAAILTATDPYYPYQWHIPETGFDSAWQGLTRNEQIKIAVLDTGVTPSHPDMEGKIGPGFDFINNDSDTLDDNGHGTYIAGIIAARANDIGIRGLYENGRILPVKVMDGNGLGTYENVASGILYAVDAGAGVLTLSLGGYGQSSLLQSAVDYAIEKGVIIVAAGGNDGLELPLYPAACPDVIGVSALDKDGILWPYSNRGTHIDIAAPGVNIISTGQNDNYVIASGTSAAVPMVAALAAILRVEEPDASIAAVSREITRTAQDLGDAGWDSLYGNGRIDAQAALDEPMAPFHDVSVAAVSAEEQILDPGIPLLLRAEIRNMGSFTPERCTVIFSKDSGGEKTEIGRIADIDLMGKRQVSITWTPGKDESEIVFGVKVLCDVDEYPANNTRYSARYSITEENNLVYIQHKSEPATQVHQFLAGEGWELLRRYLTREARVLDILGNSLDTFVFQDESDVAETDTYLEINNDSVAPLDGTNADGDSLLDLMVAEFDEYIGERILFRVGRSAELYTRRNGILDNFDSSIIAEDEYEDFDDEYDTVNLTYTGKNEHGEFARSMPYSIYYAAFQMEGRRDDAFDAFIKDNFSTSISDIDAPSSEIFSSEDSYENITRTYGGFHGELADMLLISPLGNDDIIEGAHEMDVYDTSETHIHYDGGLIAGASNFLHHFWNSDTYDDNNFDNGLYTGHSAVHVAENLWLHALDYYRDGHKDWAYYYLGRIVHLLTDMGCPPHNHNDPHPPPGDSYETIMGQVEVNGTATDKSEVKGGKNIYLNWHADTMKRELDPSLSQEDRVSPDATFGTKLTDDDLTGPKGLSIPSTGQLREADLSMKAFKEFSALVTEELGTISDGAVADLWQGHTKLFRLFYSLAEIGDDFPSDNYNGDIVLENDFGDEGFETVRDLYAPVIQPAIIEHVAGLYKLFWETTHPIPAISGTPEATTIHPDRVEISWDNVTSATPWDDATTPTSYKVYRCTAIVPTSCLLLGSSPESPYDDSQGIPGTTYFYRIKASNAYGDSSFSNFDIGIKTEPPPPDNFSLSVSRSGKGTITSDPSGIDCGTACYANYAEGTVVSLSVQEVPGYEFAGWSGGGCSGLETCNITLNENVAVSATFSKIVTTEYLLDITKIGEGSGTITSSTGAISCGTDCSAFYPPGTTVTLTIDEDAGSDFRGWGGACSGNNMARNCTIEMNEDLDVVASFGLNSYDPCYDWTWNADEENSDADIYFENIQYGEICANEYSWHETDIDNDGYPERYMLVGEKYRMWTRAAARSASGSVITKVFIDDQEKICYDGGCNDDIERYLYVSDVYTSPSNSIRHPKIEWLSMRSSVEGYYRFYDSGILRQCWDENFNGEFCDAGDHIENYIVVRCGEDSDCDTDYYCNKPTLSDITTYSCSLRDQTAAPSFTPGGATYAVFQNITIDSGTEGAAIRYTMDGSNPTSTYGTIYSEPLEITDNTSLKAIAYKNGMRDSEIRTATYTIPAVATPFFSPVGGVYSSFQNVSISTATEGAEIYFTTDESTPAPENGTLYTGPVEVRRTGTTLNARAFKNQVPDSGSASTTYFLQMLSPEVPEFTPGGGIYNWNQTVAITVATTNAAIRYTVDGSTPTYTHGTIYNEPIDLDSTTELRAIAYKDGNQDSIVVSAHYHILKEQVAVPVFTIESGHYTSSQDVIMTTETDGATIRYTTDGSNPGVTSGYLYTEPVVITESTELKAAAFKDMMIDSGVTTAEYEISLLPGDVNASGVIDLADVLVTLKILTDSADNLLVAASADIDNDGLIGWVELIYDLEEIAGYHTPLLSEDFSSGLHFWVPFGLPLPVVKESVDTFNSFVADISADSNIYNGGVYSRQVVDLSNGGVIETEYRLLELSYFGCLTEVNIALTGSRPPTTDTPAGDEHSLRWNISHIGADCSLEEIDQAHRNHNWFNFSVLTGTDSWNRSLPYSIPGDLYSWGWYKAKIIIRPDHIIEFYIDSGTGPSTLLWTSTEPLALESLQGKRLVLSGSYSGYSSDPRVNKVYFDNITIREFSVTYAEHFDDDPGFQSPSSEQVFWDSSSGDFFIGTNGSADDWVYTPDFGLVDVNKPFEIELDVKYEEQNEWGGTPVIRFFEHEPVCDPYCPYDASFSIEMTAPSSNPDSTDRVITLLDSYRSPLETAPVNMDTWYHISMKISDTYQGITISDRETGSVLYDETTPWDFKASIIDFRFMAIGIQSSADRASMRIDNISILQ